MFEKKKEKINYASSAKKNRLKFIPLLQKEIKAIYNENFNL